MNSSTYLDFDKAQNKGLRLIRGGENPTFGLLIICGINLGLRVGDLLKLKFKDLRNESMLVVEGKTKKKRKLIINDNITHALEYFKNEPDSHLCFISQKGTTYSVQHVNRLVKKYFKGKVSSHSLRKSFGRRVWNNDGQSERALLYLSEIFNHSSVAITRRYLGIRQEEIDDIYMNL